MRLLLVEDDDLLGRSLVRALGLMGYAVDRVVGAADARVALDVEVHRVVMLDIGLGDESGLDLLRHWRATGVDLPILLLTARDAPFDRVLGLDAGADDYLVKPCDLDELAARVRALRRRSEGRSAGEIRTGRLRLDPARKTCFWDDAAVLLTRREFAALQLLVEAAGQAVPKTRLESAMYSAEREPGSNAVEVHIHHLRRKLAPEAILTVRGVGYRFAGEEA